MNTTSDWLNLWFSQSEVVLHSNAAKNPEKQDNGKTCVMLLLPALRQH